MKMVQDCVSCLLKKQLAIAENIQNPEKKKKFMETVEEILQKNLGNESAPYALYELDQLREAYDLGKAHFPKEEYNAFALKLEDKIEKKIAKARDPLATALIYSRIGNYIDFGAMDKVNPDDFLKLMEDAQKTPLDDKIYEKFIKDCKKSKTFLLLCDNCGEIVLDKIFIKQLKKRFPHLQIYAMIRGAEVLNDATIDDAEQSGLVNEAVILENGGAIAGTEIRFLKNEAKACFDKAEVIVAKGQGNYESLAGTDKNIYYAFLCKCDHFAKLFGVERFTGMFIQ